LSVHLQRLGTATRHLQVLGVLSSGSVVACCAVRTGQWTQHSPCLGQLFRTRSASIPLLPCSANSSYSELATVLTLRSLLVAQCRNCQQQQQSTTAGRSSGKKDTPISSDYAKKRQAGMQLIDVPNSNSDSNSKSPTLSP
jgi:hypothetical protein